MKHQVSSILLILILIFNIFRNEIPYIEYVMLKSYIEKNLCVNKDKPLSCCEGKCFREKQINIISEADKDQSNTDNKVPKTSQTKEIKEFTYSKPQIPVAAENIVFKTFENIKIRLYSSTTSTVFVPPKV